MLDASGTDLAVPMSKRCQARRTNFVIHQHIKPFSPGTHVDTTPRHHTHHTHRQHVSTAIRAVLRQEKDGDGRCALQAGQGIDQGQWKAAVPRAAADPPIQGLRAGSDPRRGQVRYVILFSLAGRARKVGGRRRWRNSRCTFEMPASDGMRRRVRC